MAIRHEYINQTLNSIDEKHSQLDEAEGRPRVMTKERQEDKQVFADSLKGDERKFALDWIRLQ